MPRFIVNKQTATGTGKVGSTPFSHSSVHLLGHFHLTICKGLAFSLDNLSE